MIEIEYTNIGGETSLLELSQEHWKDIETVLKEVKHIKTKYSEKRIIGIIYEMMFCGVFCVSYLYMSNCKIHSAIAKFVLSTQFKGELHLYGKEDPIWKNTISFLRLGGCEGTDCELILHKGLLESMKTEELKKVEQNEDAFYNSRVMSNFIMLQREFSKEQ